MKIKESKIDKKDVIQVFLSKEEAELEINKQKIQELQTINENIVLFLSGTKSIEEGLKAMLQSEKIKYQFRGVK